MEYSILKWQKLNLSGSDNPTSKALFEKTDRHVEQWSEIGYLLIAKMTPAYWIFPWAIISYFVYFTTNLGNEAFELPVLLW